MFLVVSMCFVGIFPFVLAGLCALLVTRGTTESDTQGTVDSPVASVYQPMVILTHQSHA